ncbi:MAG: hypothetical protein AB7V32_09730 [Candidatus Berkiella sp.]
MMKQSHDMVVSDSEEEDLKTLSEWLGTTSIYDLKKKVDELLSRPAMPSTSRDDLTHQKAPSPMLRSMLCIFQSKIGSHSRLKLQVIPVGAAGQISLCDLYIH